MTDRPVTMSRATALLTAAGLVLAAAGVTYLAVRPQAEADHAAAQTSPTTPVSSGSAAAGSPPPQGSDGAAGATGVPLPDVEVTLTEEAVARAGIEVQPVGISHGADAVRIPAVIEPNAYRRVAVTPLVGGRVTRVQAELGERVERGDTLASVYSPGLAEAQTKYLTARAELEAIAQELKRTERLATIGAASQQELERARATHTSMATSLEGARAQLVLLGMTTAAIDRLSATAAVTATIAIPAPIDGIIVERQANVGLNVDPAMPLFTVVDLSNVWAVGDLYERDFPRVRVGAEATVTTTAYPGLAIGGRVTYIDPQLNLESRTARVRVEVPNPRRELRLGMFAELQIAEAAGAGTPTTTVPREAIQTIGNRHFVYVARSEAPGKFVEREVRLGNFSGAAVEITSGVKPGDAVVTKGSFFVRAERERIGSRAAQGTGAPPGGLAAKPAGTLRVTITEKGFEPARVTASAGAPVRVTFVRTTENTCAKEVLVPASNVKRPLPLNEPVVVELPPKPGEVTFTCGMKMLSGVVVIR